MDFPKATVAFDNGDEFEIQSRSRDLARAEADGIDFQALPPIRASYVAALYALRRMEKAGSIVPSSPLPESVEDLMDVADLFESTDAEGNGSGQEATPG